MPQFLNALEIEIMHRAKDFSLKQINTVYFGGGTPSLLPKRTMSHIMNLIRKQFSVCEAAEITVEVNPESLEEAFLTECVAAGVNRISLGVQTHEDKILKQIGRTHCFQNVMRAFDLIESYGIQNVNIDAILGLPTQTMESMLQTLCYVCNKEVVKHISLYALTIDEGTVFYSNKISTDADFQADLYESCVTYLERYGFYRYEISNFSKKNFESKHNQKYWTGEEYLGLGVAAHSLIGNIRSENTCDVAAYIVNPLTQKTHTLTQREQIEETIMLGLRTSKGLDLQALKEKGCDILSSKSKEINELKQIGLIMHNNNHLFLANHAYYLLNSIIVKLI